MISLRFSSGAQTIILKVWGLVQPDVFPLVKHLFVIAGVKEVNSLKRDESLTGTFSNIVLMRKNVNDLYL